MTADGRGVDSPAKLLRGATRGNGQWHVYTAIFDGARSEMYVDGRCEGAGKSVGNGSLDGLTIGCDHSGIFHLKGAVAELRLFHSHINPLERSQTEAVRRHCPPPLAAQPLARAALCCPPRTSPASTPTSTPAPPLWQALALRYGLSHASVSSSKPIG